MPSHPSSTKIISDLSLNGLRYLSAGAGFYGLTRVMSVLGPNQAAASSIINSLQGVCIGAGTGFVSSIGRELSVALGENESPTKRSALIKSAIVKGIGLGIISGGFCWTVRLWLPQVIENPQIVNDVADYMETYSGAATAEYLMTLSWQVTFKGPEKNPTFGLVNAMLYRLGNIPIAYALAVPLNLGMKGIGLTSTILGWSIIFSTHIPWFLLRDKYRQMPGLWECGIDNFFQNMKRLLHSGWQLSLQRVTEWLNLAIISQIIGSWSDEKLLSIQPSIIVLTILGLLTQGFSMTGMMLVTEDAKSFKQKFLRLSNHSSNEYDEAMAQLKTICKNINLANSIGLTINIIFFIILFFSRKSFIDWTMPKNMTMITNNFTIMANATNWNTLTNTDTVIKSEAETLFWINLLATLPDTARVISGGILQAWDDLPFSIFFSFAVMTTGIIAAVGINLGLKEENIKLFFILRALAITIAAVANVIRNVIHVNTYRKQLIQLMHDKTPDVNIQEASRGMNKTSMSSSFTFFRQDEDASAKLLQPNENNCHYSTHEARIQTGQLP